jgi:hypothetical protein
LKKNKNHFTDEHYVPTPTSCGTGECAATGELICVDGATQDTCTEGTPTADDQCDGLDNDCDGSTDEGLSELVVDAGCNVLLPPSAVLGDDCDGKVMRMLMLYTGEDCSATIHSQDPGNISCADFGTLLPSVFIHATDRSNPLDTNESKKCRGGLRVGSGAGVQCSGVQSSGGHKVRQGMKGDFRAQSMVRTVRGYGWRCICCGGRPAGAGAPVALEL